MQAIDFAVSEVSEKETKEGRRGQVVLKSNGVKGLSQIKLALNQDQVAEFSLGQFYRLNLEQVPAPTE